MAEVRGSVEAALHDEPLSRSDASGLTLGDLEPLVVPADREVVVHGSRVGFGEQGVEVGAAGQRPMHIARLGRLDRGALVSVRPVAFVEEAVGLFERADAPNPEFLDEPIL